MSLDTFWAEIDQQLAELRTARTAADVIRICPPIRSVSDPAAQGFFAGGGGDHLPDGPLSAAGWTFVWSKASYWWKMQSPDGSTITYTEGDLYAEAAS